jgi:hypothetical protein
MRRSSRIWSYEPLAFASNILMLLHATLVVGQYIILSLGATSKKPAYGFNGKSFSLTMMARLTSFAGFC